MIYLFLIYLASAAICYWIASTRSADPVFWALLALLLLGPLAIPFVFFSKPKS